jgi:hypothetical protein
MASIIRRRKKQFLKICNKRFKLNDWKYIYIFIFFFVITIITTGYIDAHEHDFQVDQDSKELCRWYANRNHEKEIAPERWAVY